MLALWIACTVVCAYCGYRSCNKLATFENMVRLRTLLLANPEYSDVKLHYAGEALDKAFTKEKVRMAVHFAGVTCGIVNAALVVWRG